MTTSLGFPRFTPGLTLPGAHTFLKRQGNHPAKQRGDANDHVWQVFDLAGKDPR